MKKLLTFWLVFAGFSTVLASEAAIRKLLTGSYECFRDMEPDKLLEMIHGDYVFTDYDGNKMTIAEVKENIESVKKMRDIITQASDPKASLLTVVTAVFELYPGIMDDESIAVINDLEKTGQGRELRDKTRETLSSFMGIYRDSCDRELKSLKVESVTITGDNAKMFHTVQDSEGKMLRTESDLVKVNGKWLFIKQTVSEISADKQ